MNSENTHQFNKKLALSCLCGKHKRNSTCEVYLRNNGKWTKEIEEMKSTELQKWLKEQGLPSLAKALKKISK